MTRLYDKGRRSPRDEKRRLERRITTSGLKIDDVRDELFAFPDRTHQYDFSALENLLDSMNIDTQEAFHR